jgi:glycosyltransferase involved in cell wall biosynthesis
MTARVSVLTPTYNCASLLRRAIASAFNQTLAPFEVIVIDDGSTDETPCVLAELAEVYGTRLVVERKPNGGEASARNRAVARARGELLAFIDQDDQWHPRKLELQVQLMAEDPSLDACFTAYQRITGTRRETVRLADWRPAPEFVLRQLMIGSCMTPSTVMLTARAVGSLPRFDESLWLGSDWTYWLEVAAAGFRVGYLPDVLVDYDWHGGNMSADARKISAAALEIFPRLFDHPSLPPSVRRMRRWCLARWLLIDAENAASVGSWDVTRRRIKEAIRTRPASIRPGWLALLWRSHAENHSRAHA